MRNSRSSLGWAVLILIRETQKSEHQPEVPPWTTMAHDPQWILNEVLRAPSGTTHLKVSRISVEAPHLSKEDMTITRTRAMDRHLEP